MLERIVNHGPLVASVDATTWNDYQGGIIMYHCPDHNNHAVQIVGYDLTGKTDFTSYTSLFSKRDFYGKGVLFQLQSTENFHKK
jgi:cathepsin O